MNLNKIEENLEFQVVDSPNIFGANVSQVTGIFNPKAIIKTPIDPKYSNFSKNRLIDFLAGRICAIKAINKIRPINTLLPIGKNNAPIWPEDLCGSISHSRNIVTAAVFQGTKNESIGLDVEMIFDTDTSQDLEKEILLPGERAFINPHNPSDVMTLLYSAKEATYKAQNFFTESFLDFREIKITAINFSSKIFEVEIKPNKKHLKGSFSFMDSFIYTGVEIN